MEYGTAWIVIEAMLEEIRRQQGQVLTVHDNAGRVHICGEIDLPALASATEEGLREAYPPKR